MNIGCLWRRRKLIGRDLAPVHVNCVCQSEQVQMMGENMIKSFTTNLPLPRGSTVEEAADAHLYLIRNTCTTAK